MKESLSIKMNKVMVLFNEMITYYNTSIESANRNGDVDQANKLKAELLTFQKTDGYIGAVQLEDERLIGSSSALIDVIVEQIKAQQIKIRMCKQQMKKRATVLSNLTDVDLLRNQNLTSTSKIALSLAPGTAAIDGYDSEGSNVPFNANNPDTFPINIDPRLYEVTLHFVHFCLSN